MTSAITSPVILPTSPRGIPRLVAPWFLFLFLLGHLCLLDVLRQGLGVMHRCCCLDTTLSMIYYHIIVSWLLLISPAKLIKLIILARILICIGANLLRNFFPNFNFGANYSLISRFIINFSGFYDQSWPPCFIHVPCMMFSVQCETCSYHESPFDSGAVREPYLLCVLHFVVMERGADVSGTIHCKHSVWYRGSWCSALSISNKLYKLLSGDRVMLVVHLETTVWSSEV